MLGQQRAQPDATLVAPNLKFTESDKFSAHLQRPPRWRILSTTPEPEEPQERNRESVSALDVQKARPSGGIRKQFDEVVAAGEALGGIGLRAKETLQPVY